MRAGIVAGAVVVAALAGCGSGGSSSAASVQDQPSVMATLNWAQRACKGTTGVFEQVAGPLEKHDAAGVAAAGRTAEAMGSVISNLSAAVEYPYVVEYADTVLGIIADMGNNAVSVEDYGWPWSSITVGDTTLASSFRSLESACSAAGVTIYDGGSPVARTPAQGEHSAAAIPTQSAAASASLPSWTPSPDPYSKGCPTSGQLLAAWNAARASARDSWTTLTVTGFFGTECWHQWVVTSPIMDGNTIVAFTDTDGQLSLLPETDVSELDAAICGVPGAPTVSWAGPGGPANCSQSS